MRWEPYDRLGASLTRTLSAHRTGFDRHNLRPNNLFQLVLFGRTFSVFWPRRRQPARP